MASTALHIVRDFSLPSLGRQYHSLFSDPDELKKPLEGPKTLGKKKKKKAKNEEKEGKKLVPPVLRPLPAPRLELHGNPSEFGVFAQVRQTVLERQLRNVLREYSQRTAAEGAVSDTDDDEDAASKIEIPKIVSVGLSGVFELIRDTHRSYPELCARALQALLNILQGQELEAMENEPADAINSMYELLIDIVRQSSVADDPHSSVSLPSLASACLLSLVLARGDTGLLLQTISTLLKVSADSKSQMVQVPGILLALQRSVLAYLLGESQGLQWHNNGVKKDTLIDHWQLKQLPSAPEESFCALASDGRNLYLCSNVGLLKVGSGYCGTGKGQIYASNEDFHPETRGWLGYARGKLYYCRVGLREKELLVINTETLQPQGTVPLDDQSSGIEVLFSTGDHIGYLQASKEGNFCLRHFDPSTVPMKAVHTRPLALAQRGLYSVGNAEFEDDSKLHLFFSEQQEDIEVVEACKEFALIKTASGKLYYTGKASALGIKAGGPAPGQWEELTFPSAVKATQVSAGQGGEFAVAIGDDYQAYFFGLARRGEDGDQVQGRRRQKPIKAKKMGQNKKLKDKQYTFSACNASTSALVTKDGQLVMFGKDTEQCDSTTGIMPNFLGLPVETVAMGKGHFVVLLKSGAIYTFGLNNKGQCGRCYVRGTTSKQEENSGQPDQENGAAAAEGSEDKAALSAATLTRTPAEIRIGPEGVRTKQVACGAHHTLVLLENGDVYTFGQNQHGQLGHGDTEIRGSPCYLSLPRKATQVAAGSSHSVVLLENGEVYTFGKHEENQLGRSQEIQHEAEGGDPTWHLLPQRIKGIGEDTNRRATWIGASGNQTFLRLDELLLKANSLQRCQVFASCKTIGIVPPMSPEDDEQTATTLFFNKRTSTCITFQGSDQKDLSGQSVCLDPSFDVLWSYSPVTQEISCYDICAPVVKETMAKKLKAPSSLSILSPNLAVPRSSSAKTSQFHLAVNVLACLQTLTELEDAKVTPTRGVLLMSKLGKRVKDKVSNYHAAYRFSNFGGGWGYSGHSVEAIRFSPDQDVVLCGLGLFGGRGNYRGGIKIYDIGELGGDNETDGDLVGEVEEHEYECPSREYYHCLLDEAVPLLANNWYIAWARVSGPSSDCGSAGQSKITTEDDVTFHIKSSRKSNNGTDMGSGQIPAILYKIPSFEKDAEEQTEEPVHILDRKFSRTVTVSNFDSLLNMLRWAWSDIQQHSLSSLTSLRANAELAAVQDVEKLSFIAVACLKLLQTYICEVYPSGAKTNKTPSETEEIATAVLETRSFLSTLLEDSGDNEIPVDPDVSEVKQKIRSLRTSLINNCRGVFLNCFHAFYPTGQLKWLALSELLQQVDLTGHGAPAKTRHQLAAVMDALSSSRVRLSGILPPVGDESGSFQTVSVMSDRQSRFPLLESFITLQTGVGEGDGGLTFKQVISKLLAIVAAPVHCATAVAEKGNESMAVFPDELVKSSGRLITSIVGELALSATLSSSPYETSSPQMQESPSRFGAVQQTNWNTGNGSADAISFKVDRSGITLVGVSMYGGGGTHRYELELLSKKETVAVGAGIFGGGGDGWKPVAHVRGDYGDSDCNSDKIAHLMFDSPVPIDANTVYAIRFRNHGSRTANGTTGRAKVTCNDGMIIMWSSCTLSNNGTGENRGQIPSILYCTSTAESLEQPEAPPPAVAESLRQSTITIVTSVLEIASELLDRASGMQAETGIHSVLGGSHLFKSLLPLLLAQLGPVAASTPQTSVEVLEVIKQVLPSVTNLSQQISLQPTPDSTPFHHMIVESEHPYKPGIVSHYRVNFPELVQWLVLEFDSQSATAQPEDRLNVLIPRHSNSHASDSDVVLSSYWSVLKPFSGADDWPKHAVVLPGHEVVFSLETASEYSKDENVSRYGFKCTVIGHVWQPQPQDTILLLEKELAYLAGMCAGSLMKSDLPVPIIGEDTLPADETEDQQVARQLNDAGAQHIVKTHLSLVGRGLSLESRITVQDALTGELHFAKASSEKEFLIQFLECTPDTSGGRLARWLQPDAFVDPAKSEVVLSGNFQVGYLAQIGLQTKDRQGTSVHVSDMKVVLKGTFLGNKKPKPFGSAPPEIPESEALHEVIKAEENKNDETVKQEVIVPGVNTSYKETLQGTKDKYVSISMMKEYQNFSFEELRFHTPANKRPDQTWSMDMQDNQDGTYIAGWIPSSRGSYNVEVSIDGTLAGNSPIEVDVEDAVGGMQATPSVVAMPVSFPQKSKVRKFVAPAKTGGLRIRSQPSLQSEELGVIRPEQRVAFTDEVTNDDGTWIKLKEETIIEYTGESHEEAWCLSFHKKLDRQLLVDVEESVMTTQPIPVATAGYSPPCARKMKKKWIDGAGEYEVIRCGEAGHNIRNRPSLKGTPVGLLCRTSRIKASIHVNNADGDWLKLERESVETYCEKEGEAWTLARTATGIVYLEQEVESEYETDSESDEETATASGAAAASHPQPVNGLELAHSFRHPVAALPLVPPMPGVGVNRQQIQNIMMRQLQEHQQQEGGVFFRLPLPPAMLFGAANNAQPPGPFGALPFGAVPRQPIDNAQAKGGFQFGQPFGGNVPVPAFGFGHNVAPQQQPPPAPFQFSLSPAKEGGDGEEEKKDKEAKGFSFGAAAASPAGGEKATSPVFTLGLSPQKFKHEETTKKASRSGRSGKGRSPARFGGKTEKGTTGERGKVRKALSPAVAKCMRAVFAAFMWHEGITHDAMACASYLKFHPELTKDMGKQKEPKKKDQEPDTMKSEKDKKTEPPKKEEVKKKEETVENKEETVEKKEETVEKKEETVEKKEEMVEKKEETVKKEEPEKKEETIKKEEETIKKEEPEIKQDIVKEEELEKTEQEVEKTEEPEVKESEEKALEEKESTKKEEPTTEKLEPIEITKEGDSVNKIHTKEKQKEDEEEPTPEPKLPPTLRHLVAFWDELVGGIQLATSKKLSQPKIPELKIRAKIVERPETEQPVAKEQPKPKPKVAGPGQTICELCDEPFPNPVTYHMKRAHPGCGKHAAGQGYNSGGTYCGGWAGNCGDGGHGGSTWYLMCNSCHDKYVDQKKEQSLVQDKRMKQAGVVVRMASGKPRFKSSASTDAHTIITENCRFLLELESAGENKVDDLGRLKSPVTTPLTDKLSWEETLQPEQLQSLDLSISPSRKFQYLQRGVSVPGIPGMLPSKAKLAILEKKRRAMIARSPSIEDRITMTLERGKARTFDHLKAKKQEPQRPSLLRSVSVAVTGTMEDKEGEEANKAIKRKHSPVWTSADDTKKQYTRGPVNLVERMSPKLYKLVQRQQTEAEEDKQSSPSEMALKRPLLAFVCQQLDLDCIRRSMIKALIRSACRVHAMESFEWHLRCVTQTAALHDLMWFFAASLTPPPPPESDGEEKKEGEKKEKEEVDLTMGEHPTEGLLAAGDGLIHLTSTFHSLLKTIADLMGQLPQGSAVQQMAMRCWCLHFQPRDHTFLHRSYVFSRINQMLTHVDEDESRNNGSSQLPAAAVSVVLLPGLLTLGKVTASSRPAMLDSLSDSSTETFWESGDEDKHRSRWLQIVFEQPDIRPEVVYIHIDNNRDSGNRTEFVTLNVGNSSKTVKKIKEADIPYRFGGWIRLDIPNPSDTKVIKLDLKGTQNSLRIRQLKIQGYSDAASEQAANITSGHSLSPIVAQRKQCEAETLRVFRLLTSQVFGKLVAEQQDSEMSDLKEHVVGILFGQSKLSSLQKQVCEHIVDSIRSETARVRDEWEAQLNFPDKAAERLSDTYCFELLSMVLALSGSEVGRAYIAEQYSLLTNLLALLHTGTPRVQRQVVSVLRRILSLVSPHRLAHTLGIASLPKPGFSAVTEATDASGTQNNLEKNPGILDVLLAVVAKALSVQVKSKGAKKGGDGVLAGKGPHTVTVMSLLTKPAEGLVTNETLGQEGSRWWLRGQMQAEVATEVIKLLNDMSLDKFSKEWTEVTKAGVGEAVLSLTKLDEKSRSPVPCMHGPTIWLTLSSLCVLTEEHVEQLSSGQWSAKEEGKKKPTCDNHDDGETVAIIECDSCGNLCAECDRVLHFSKKNKTHSRTVFKEEEEAVKVDLNEGCGRTKLFWVMVLADSRTLKAMVEFKDTGAIGLSSASAGSTGVCRFCGSVSSTGLLAIGNVCAEPECQERVKKVCIKTLPCGHMCCGVRDENSCPSCLFGCRTDESDQDGAVRPGRRAQDADDMCMICYSENLSAAPVIQLGCGHIYHYHCCEMALEKRWTGPRITFRFLMCPICETKQIKHKSLVRILRPLEELHEDVRRKALMRLEYDNLHKCEAITTPGTPFFQKPADFAVKRYAYYVCFKCNRAYYGGEARCVEQAGLSDEYDPSELVCGGCSDVASAQVCSKHGTDYLEYKCRYCCSVAVFFCFGTTHFCAPCHDDFQRLTSKDKSELPQCPVGPTCRQLEGTECPLHVKHPPTGEEFALGCGVCRNAQTF